MWDQKALVYTCLCLWPLKSQQNDEELVVEEEERIARLEVRFDSVRGDSGPNIGQHEGRRYATSRRL